MDGVGVDGVGGSFPFILLFFAFLRFFCFSFFLYFLRFLLILLGQEQRTTIYWRKDGEFHSDPVCADLIRKELQFTGGKIREFHSDPVCADRIRKELQFTGGKMGNFTPTPSVPTSF